MIPALFVLACGILYRLRGYSPADVYDQAGLEAPSLARWVSRVTSKGVIAILFGALVPPVLEPEHPVLLGVGMAVAFYAHCVFDRGRIFAAYDGRDKRYEGGMGAWLGNRIKSSMRLRGFVEAFFFALVTLLPMHVVLSVDRRWMGLYPLPISAVLFAIAYWLPGFLPERFRWWTITYRPFRIERLRAPWRHEVAEFLAGMAIAAGVVLYL